MYMVDVAKTSPGKRMFANVAEETKFGGARFIDLE
jgi:hypothetical protein